MFYRVYLYLNESETTKTFFGCTLLIPSIHTALRRRGIHNKTTTIWSYNRARAAASGLSINEREKKGLYLRSTAKYFNVIIDMLPRHVKTNFTHNSLQILRIFLFFLLNRTIILLHTNLARNLVSLEE